MIKNDFVFLEFLQCFQVALHGFLLKDQSQRRIREGFFFQVDQFIERCEVRCFEHIFVDVVTVTLRAAILYSIAASPARRFLPASHRSDLPPELCSTVPAFQQTAERVFAGKPAVAYRLGAGASSAIKFFFCQLEQS